MKKIIEYKKTILVLFLVVLSLLMSSISGFSAQQQISLHEKISAPQSTAYASISIYVFEGESCACKPVVDAYIFAEAITTDHLVTGYTNEDGLCVLELEYDQTYRFTLDIEPFQKMIFDIEVIDHQSFWFYMQPKDDSVVQNLEVSSLSQHIHQLKN